MYQMSRQYSPVSNYSKLESLANTAYSISSPSTQEYTSFSSLFSSSIPTFDYTGGSYFVDNLYQNNDTLYNLFTPQKEYHFSPDNFLKPGKEGIFVGEAEEIKGYIEETFEKIFSQQFPSDIKISICNHKEFRKIAPSPGVIGLSLNRRKYGLLSEIFVLNDSLGRVMLTLGHELGHVLTETLKNPQDEEAKAYSFSYAWMKKIKENNIAGLQDAIVLENPAQNGLHNVAFNFVNKLIEQGKDVWEIYLYLVEQILSVNSIRHI